MSDKKVVAVIPIKSISRRVKNKNFRLINNKPLYRYLLDNLKYCNFNEVYVDSDSVEIEKYCKKAKYKFIKRLPRLAQDNASGNDVLNYHQSIVDADYYFQIYITAPLLSVKTINNCIKLLVNNKKIDSVFTIKKIYSWFWFNNNPVNYNPKALPRSQDAQPIIQETTGLYGIKKKTLKKMKCRIGKKPFMYEVESEEALDLDEEKDFQYLDYYVKYLRSSR